MGHKHTYECYTADGHHGQYGFMHCQLEETPDSAPEPVHDHSQCRNKQSHSAELCRPKSLKDGGWGEFEANLKKLNVPQPAVGLLGIGGAPTRATTFPDDSEGRKRHPVASGVLDYFPDALVAISEVSWWGNEQHNKGQPLHWARSKSTDEADCLIRHFLQRGTRDTDGLRHSAKMAWRALALLQKEIESERSKA